MAARNRIISPNWLIESGLDGAYDTFTSKLQRTWSEGVVATLLLLDVSGAYDNISVGRSHTQAPKRSAPHRTLC